MDYSNKKLYLFTAEYPFGNKSETFIETEINYLSGAFKEVVIFPSFNELNGVRFLPDNVTLNTSRTNLDFSGKNKWKALLRNVFMAVRVICFELTHRNWMKVFSNMKALLDHLAQSLIAMEALSKEIKLDKEVILYDYWFINSTMALSMLKSKGRIAGFISRGHRFDIYDDRNLPYGVPFRKWKMKWIDKLFIISEDGLQYVKKKVGKKYESKVFISRLGVEKRNLLPTLQERETKRIVSCSSLLDFKGVHLIPLVLKQIKRPIEWIHFGDGPYRKELEMNLREMPANISVQLMGHKNNYEVIQFYESNQVDLFLSLSSSEGLPVSMMEAQSFGIPIVARSAGGIREIVVTGKTGILIEDKFDIDHLASIVEAGLLFKFDREVILSFFNREFEASQNYTNFIEQLNL